MTNRQRLFVIEYLQCWNATEAARRAGYKNPNKRGPELVVKGGIAEAIEQALTEKAMPASEVLFRLTQMARGDLGDAIASFPVGKGSIAMVDWDKLVKSGKTHLVKKFKVTKDGVEIELHDPQRALELLGKHHRLFVDRIEATGKDGAAIVFEVKGIDLGEDI